VAIETFRIGKTKFADSFFDGEGSYKYGGRWNSKGKRVIYTAESLSLATLEIVVHFDAAQVRAGYSFAAAGFSEKQVLSVEELAELPKNWRDSPAPLQVQDIGDAWVQSKSSLVLRVPTAILPIGFNYLVNIEHPDFSKLKIGDAKPLSLDERLLDS